MVIIFAVLSILCIFSICKYRCPLVASKHAQKDNCMIISVVVKLLIAFLPLWLLGLAQIVYKSDATINCFTKVVNNLSGILLVWVFVFNSNLSRAVKELCSGSKVTKSEVEDTHESPGRTISTNVSASYNAKEPTNILLFECNS